MNKSTHFNRAPTRYKSREEEGQPEAFPTKGFLDFAHIITTTNATSQMPKKFQIPTPASQKPLLE